VKPVTGYSDLPALTSRALPRTVAWRAPCGQFMQRGEESLLRAELEIKQQQADDEGRWVLPVDPSLGSAVSGRCELVSLLLRTLRQADVRPSA